MAAELPLEASEMPGEQRKDGPHRADFDLIRELAVLLDETGLSEIEIGEGPERIRVARTMVGGAVAVAALAAASQAEPAGADSSEAAPPAIVDSNHPGAVVSPLVGIAFHAPEPGAEPFVKVGDTVSEGQTLFIVEAMKTMNPIKAPRGGRVASILIENGTPVEYGEVLLVLE